METRNDENDYRIPTLVGRTVIKTEQFATDWESGWKIFFSDGSILTALDGEYGDDAFSFVVSEGE